MKGKRRWICLLAVVLLLLGAFSAHAETSLESITALNKGMINFRGNMLFATHDQEIIETVANRIIDIQDEDKIIDFTGTYEEYVEKFHK